MPNCEVWGTVDFGHGPVEIRCTEVGEHEYHRCSVWIDSPVPQDSVSHNVFEKKR